MGATKKALKFKSLRAAVKKKLPGAAMAAKEERFPWPLAGTGMVEGRCRRANNLMASVHSTESHWHPLERGSELKCQDKCAAARPQLCFAFEYSQYFNRCEGGLLRNAPQCSRPLHMR